MIIDSSTIAEGWEESIRYLLSEPTIKTFIPTERGSNSIEINNLQLNIEFPDKEKRLSDLYPHTEYKELYSKELLNQSYLNQVYSRITNFTNYSNVNINQLDELKSKLLNDWYTRRAVIDVWEPCQDLHSEHPPCICFLQFYIREQKLNLTAVLRSNDAWLCAPVDMLAITDMQKELAGKIGINIGTYCHIATSYHIYDYDIPAALSIFKDKLNNDINSLL